MGYITDEQVARVNDQIGQAGSAARALQILDGLTRTMVDRLLDLNGVDVDSMHGRGLVARRHRVAEEHGWTRPGTVPHPPTWPGYIDNR